MKKIFITGASSGIGRAIATLAMECGHDVWGTSRNRARLGELSRIHPVELDLANPHSIETAFRTALAEAGHFDVVINNAGSGHFGAAENLSQELIASQFQILVFGQLQLMQLALGSMRPRGSGLIINISSLASRLPVPFMAAYNAAKGALASFTMSTQLELGESTVRIVDLQPADIQTDFNRDIVRSGSDSTYAWSLDKTWEAVERNMSAAPKAELVAEHVLRLIGQANPPPRIAVGGFFQTRVAPLIFRLIPQRLRIWGLKKYYGI